jgi:iron(III) transport system substrate-binding protein
MKKSLTLLVASLAFTAQALAAERLTVYSAGPAPLSAELAKAFEDETGIQVDLFQSSAGKIMARYQAEKSNPQVDVIISASWDHAITLEAAGELLPYQSMNALMVPDSLKTASYVAQGAAALAIAYNPNSGLPKPAHWNDLTKPVYKGQVTMPDPAKSGSALTLVQGLVAQDATQAWQLFDGLAANEMLVPGANAAALNPVLQGAKGVVFGAVDYVVINAQAKGEDIDVVYPSEGTVLAPRPIMIPRSTQHVDAAEAFVDFLLSEQAQKMVAAQFILPARTDVAAKRPGWDDLNIINYDAVQAASDAAQTKAQFAQRLN